MVKRKNVQYSRKNMTTQQDGDEKNKRRKPTPPDARVGRFSGPVSFGESDEDLDLVIVTDEDKDKDEAKERHKNNAAGRPKIFSNTGLSSQPSIHGSRANFESYRKKNMHHKADGAAPTANNHMKGSYTGSCGANTKSIFHKPISNGLSKFKSSLNHALSNESQPARAYHQKPSPMSQSAMVQPAMSQQTMSQTSIEAVKKPYVPNSNEVVNVKAPEKDLLGKPIVAGSAHEFLWNLNQKESPLLCLPAEVRNLIYQFVLGGKAIHLGYWTYMRNMVDGRRTTKPVFKYWAEIHSEKYDPTRAPTAPWPKKAKQETFGMTLLNNVSRQLYHETAFLPFEFNRLVFDSHNIMMNFLVLDRVLAKGHCAAIKELIVNDVLPGAGLLKIMTGLERVGLVFKSNDSGPQGWYRVVRGEARPKLKKEWLSRR